MFLRSSMFMLGNFKILPCKWLIVAKIKLFCFVRLRSLKTDCPIFMRFLRTFIKGSIVAVKIYQIQSHIFHGMTIFKGI